MEQQHHSATTDQQIEIIDIELFTKERRHPPHGHHYRVKIGADYYVFCEQCPTREAILEKVGYKHLECHLLYLLIRDAKLELIEPGQRVDLARPGIEHFLVADPEVWHYIIDNEKESTEHRELTPNQILEKAGITPVKDYYLVRVFADGSKDSYKDRMNQPIKMVCPQATYVSIYNGSTPVS